MTLTLTLTGNPNNNPNPDPDRNHKRSTTWKSKGRPKRRCKREGVICHCSRLVYRCQLLDHHSHTHKRAAHIYLHYHTRSRTHILPHAYTYSPPCTYKPYNHTHTHTVAHMYVQRCGIMVEPGAHPHKTLGGPFTHAHSLTHKHIHTYTHTHMYRGMESWQCKVREMVSLAHTLTRQCEAKAARNSKLCQPTP